MKLDVVMKQFTLNILKLHLNKTYCNKGRYCCFADRVKNHSCWLAFKRLWINLILTLYDDRYYCILHFDTSLIDLSLDSRSQECEKAKTCAPIISQSFQSTWMEFSLLLRLVGVMNLILVFSWPFNKGENPTYMILFVWGFFMFLSLDIDLYSDIYRLVSFKLSMTIETTQLYIFISVWMTFTFIQGHSCMRNQNFCGIFS